MHQVASSILSLFISPFNWIIISVIASYLFRKPILKRTCRISAFFIFILFTNAWLLNWFAKNWQPPPVIISASNTYSCGILMGGFGSPDTEENGYFNSTSDRFIQVVKLYKTGKINYILIDGGNGKSDKKNFREGEWAKSELTATGIPDSAIIVEDRSNNTSDNAFYAKQILDSLQLKPPYLLITSAYHIPRASLLFKNAGVPIIPFPCNYISGRSDFALWSLLPQPFVLSDWNLYLKEAAGYIWYSLKNN